MRYFHEQRSTVPRSCAYCQADIPIGHYTYRFTRTVYNRGDYLCTACHSVYAQGEWSNDKKLLDKIKRMDRKLRKQNTELAKS